MATGPRKIAATAAFGLLGIAATLASRRARSHTRLLAGKVVFITGGSRGLGLALAEDFVRAGARVAISARDTDTLAEAERRLAGLALSGRSAVTAVRCDVTDPSTVESAVADASRTLGPIDILVNNAGIIAVAPLANQSVRRFEEAMNTHLYGPLHTTQAVLPEMLRRGTGIIVNIASIGGLIAVPHLLPYTASKFALVGFSRGLHAELRSKGIHVLTVCPWLMRTGSHLHAKFGGRQDHEFGWFGVGATLPGLAVPAHKAAREIVRAILDRKSELLISPWATATAAFAHLAPSLTNAVLAQVNRILPEADPLHGDQQMEGKEAHGVGTIIPDALGSRPAEAWNQGSRSQAS
ncbi:MAG TPA: SDR family NAD(P)-dependent oxidoreductase [Acidobacteriaceae bacterium]